MSAPQRVRSMIVALLGTLAVALGVVTLAAPAAQAAPPATAEVAFPFDNKGIDDNKPEAPDKKADKAEKLGGKVTTEVIDLVTDIVKCGLNIALPAVKC